MKRYKAKHILISELDDANELYQQLLDETADFEELAKDYSECDSAKNGGHLGWFNSGQMIAEFERELANLEKLKISTPLKTKFGYHIIVKLDEKDV